MADSPISAEEQNEITRVCVLAAQILMQHGTESALVETVARRLGLALGADSVEVALMAHAITLTTLCGKRSQTTVRRAIDHGVNMHMSVQVQRVMLDAEAHRCGTAVVAERLEALRPFHYPHALVVVMVGLSCAAFAWLAGASWCACLLTFAASATGMAIRQQLAHWHFSPIINFTLSAFVVTSITAQGLIHNWGIAPADARLAMASCVLFFVPGVPLINGVSDMVKGYMNTGIARLGVASLLSIGTCIGILFATLVWGAHAWL